MGATVNNKIRAFSIYALIILLFSLLRGDRMKIKNKNSREHLMFVTFLIFLISLNFVYSTGESCISDSDCNGGEICSGSVCTAQNLCGDGVCSGETPVSCPQDCKYCDDKCDPQGCFPQSYGKRIYTPYFGTCYPSCGFKGGSCLSNPNQCSYPVVNAGYETWDCEGYCCVSSSSTVTVTASHTPQNPSASSTVVITVGSSQVVNFLDINVGSTGKETCLNTNTCTFSFLASVYGTTSYDYYGTARSQAIELGRSGTNTITLGGGSSQLTATPNSVNIGVGENKPNQATISGGSGGYSIKEACNSAIAWCDLLGPNKDSLYVEGRSAGSTAIKVKDSVNAEVTVTVNVGTGGPTGCGARGWRDYPSWGQCQECDQNPPGCGGRGCGEAEAFCDGTNWNNQYSPFVKDSDKGTATSGHACPCAGSTQLCNGQPRPTTPACPQGQTYQCVNTPPETGNFWVCRSGTSSCPACSPPGSTDVKARVLKAQSCLPVGASSMDCLVTITNGFGGCSISRTPRFPGSSIISCNKISGCGTGADLFSMIENGPGNCVGAAGPWRYETGGSGTCPACTSPGTTDVKARVLQAQSCMTPSPSSMDCLVSTVNSWGGGQIKRRCCKPGGSEPRDDTIDTPNGRIIDLISSCCDLPESRWAYMDVTDGGGIDNELPKIDSVTPNPVKTGATLTINGKSLVATVQYFDSARVMRTYIGHTNSAATQIIIPVPSDFKPGQYTVRIYAAADRISNEVPVTVIAGTQKCSPDGSACGYCEEESQCLLDPLTPTETQCISSGQYSGDNFCDKGQWTTRTKLLALKLLKLKSADYVLFCDKKEVSLNTLQYLTASSQDAYTALSNFDPNNFCVLKNNNAVIGGASLNGNLSTNSGSINVFGVTNCNGAMAFNDNQYHPCGSNNVWYNNGLNSIIFSSTSISISSDQEQTSFIVNIIQSIIDAIKGLIIKSPYDESYLNSIMKFRQLYMSIQGSKSIMGSMDFNGQQYLNTVIEYRGFDDNLCVLVDSYNVANSDPSSGIACAQKGQDFYVLAQGSQFTKLNPDDVWLDLTSKLRIK